MHSRHGPRRRRSVLYVPANNARALAKLPSLACDAVILDLEDAVAPDAKAEARTNARAILENGERGHREIIVRVNGLESESGNEWFAEDLAAIAPVRPDAILAPKVRTADDVLRIETALAHHYAPSEVQLWLMMETPSAILNAPAIAGLAAREGSRLTCLVAGTNDLAKEMRLPITASRLALLHALSGIILAARAFDLDALDGVFADIADIGGLESECLQGRGLGFDGKTLIHPGQIETANRIFAPSPTEIENARRIVAAFESPENAGKAVLLIDGKMAERLHYESARRILAFAG